MNINWIVEDKVAYLDIEKDDLFRHADYFSNLGIGTIVTFDKYDYSLIWKINGSIPLRHYLYPASEFPIPTEWELLQLNEFIVYETEHDRKVLLWFKEKKTFEVTMESIEDRFIKGNERIVTRPYILTHCKACIEKGCETGFLCHTSSIESAKSILQSGFLLSACRHREKSGIELSSESRNAAGDPLDYFYYVMLSYGNCIAGDRLVTERNLGRIPTDQDLTQEFHPGVRYYFKTEALEKHPNYRQDGYHPCKIKDCIDLDQYLFYCIVPQTDKKLLEKHIKANLAERIIYLDPRPIKDIFEWTHQVYQAIKDKTG